MYYKKLHCILYNIFFLMKESVLSFIKLHNLGFLRLNYPH